MAGHPIRGTIFDDPALFLDRDFSLIEFQRRVFEEARDEENAVLERLRFLSIVVSNFDEFEMVRMPQLALSSVSRRIRRHLVRIRDSTSIGFAMRLFSACAMSVNISGTRSFPRWPASGYTCSIIPTLLLGNARKWIVWPTGGSAHANSGCFRNAG